MRHIKNDDFQLVQIGLDENLRLKDIASIIEKDDRAVSKHIKKYRVFKPVFKNMDVKILINVIILNVCISMESQKEIPRKI